MEPLLKCITNFPYYDGKNTSYQEKRTATFYVGSDRATLKDIKNLMSLRSDSSYYIVSLPHKVYRTVMDYDKVTENISLFITTGNTDLDLNYAKGLMGEYEKEDNPESSNFIPGYHLEHIEKGKLGSVSKIVEEVKELQDAEKQDIKIMIYNELSDLYGAIEAYAENKGITMQDIVKMAEATKRAFESGRRK